MTKFVDILKRINPFAGVKATSAVIVVVALCIGVGLGMKLNYALAAPTSLVNGNFEYPGRGYLVATSYNHVWVDTSKTPWTAQPWGTVEHDPGSDGSSWDWFSVPGFSMSSFGWYTTDNGGLVELEKEAGGNVCGEITAETEYSSIYQDISTVPGVVYVWSLKHASSGSPDLVTPRRDKMNVLIGPGGTNLTNAYAQGAYRTYANSVSGDTVGPVGTIISTYTPNGEKRNTNLTRDNMWESYRGEYKVPEGQYLTRFAFHSVDGYNECWGNMVDDITFQMAYPLKFDLNGGSGAPSETRLNSSSGLYEGYYDDTYKTWTRHYLHGEVADVRSAPTKSKCRFLGWSTSDIGDINTKEKYDQYITNNGIPLYTTTYTMPNSATADGITLHAVYVTYGGLSGSKVDEDLNTANPQGNASLSGVTVQVINNNGYTIQARTNGTGAYRSVAHGGVCFTITGDSNGHLSTVDDALQSGNYLLRETSAPTGYRVASSDVAVSVS